VTKRERTKLERTAYHEAGHAVAAYVLHRALGHVSIEPERGSLGHMKTRRFEESFQPDAEVKRGTRERLEKEIMVCLAGPIAERRFVGRLRQDTIVGASRDFNDAARCADCLCGNSEETDAYLAWLSVRATNLIKLAWHWRAIQTLAEALLEHRRIGHRKVREIIKQAFYADLKACGLGCAAEKGLSLPPARKSTQGKPKGGLHNGRDLQER
jgi:hypothetical protein